VYLDPGASPCKFLCMMNERIIYAQGPFISQYYCSKDNHGDMTGSELITSPNTGSWTVTHNGQRPMETHQMDFAGARPELASFFIFILPVIRAIIRCRWRG
jgi:hypothetical protein